MLLYNGENKLTNATILRGHWHGVNCVSKHGAATSVHKHNTALNMCFLIVSNGLPGAVLMLKVLLQKTFSVQVFCSGQLPLQLWPARQTLALRIAEL
jgi:hypothetical protein